MPTWNRRAIGAGLFGFAVFALGCGQESKGTKPTAPVSPSASTPAAETGPFAAGKAVFADNDCKKCHQVDASAGRGKAPNLATVGKIHTVEWLIAHIKNPKTHEPMSKMPSFEGKISDNDLKSLAEYLASLK